MKKLIIKSALLLVILGLIGTGVILLRRYDEKKGSVEYTLDVSIKDTYGYQKEVAKENQNVDYDKESGTLFVNNEIIVFSSAKGTYADIQTLADAHGAELDTVNSDLGMYLFSLRTPKEYADINSLVEEITGEDCVEQAFINPVTMQERDDEDAVEHRKPVYPKGMSYWDDGEWNVLNPQGANWGMEAIDAPGAWAYRDEMVTVRVGLIDQIPSGDHPDLVMTRRQVGFYNSTTGGYYVRDVVEGDQIGHHGTHVAGTIGATWNNGDGVDGVLADKGELYYCNSTGNNQQWGSVYNFINSIQTLVDQDVRVINISLSTGRLIAFSASMGNAQAIEDLEACAEIAQTALKRIIQNRIAEGKGDFLLVLSAGNTNDDVYYVDKSSPYGYTDVPGAREDARMGNSLAKYNNYLALMDDPVVKDRVVVVGAVGHKEYKFNTSTYFMAPFSCVGDRVDIVAPGMGICSTYYFEEFQQNGYDDLDGTSMSAPHVTGVAGLVFAANPSLTGPEVKKILVGTATGKYYQNGRYSATYNKMVNARAAVEAALATRDNSIGTVIPSGATSGGLDLCFVVDTTGSMDDDIANAKKNMASIIEKIAEKSENYRVALIDYRDYAERTQDSRDYPVKVQLQFTNEKEAIIDAINALDIGYGGDGNETVYSGLMESLKLEWRSSSSKAIILIGDAAPLDPEPYTGYTLDMVKFALYNAGVGIDYDQSDDRVLGEPGESSINVFSIGTEADSAAKKFFDDISEVTGGSFVNINAADELADAIVDSIEQIEVVELATVKIELGAAFAGNRISVYDGKKFLFDTVCDEDGYVQLTDMDEGKYTLVNNATMTDGEVRIKLDADKKAKYTEGKSYWFSGIVQRISQSYVTTVLIALAVMFALLEVPVVLEFVIKKKNEKNKVKVQG